MLHIFPRGSWFQTLMLPRHIIQGYFGSSDSTKEQMGGGGRGQICPRNKEGIVSKIAYFVGERVLAKVKIKPSVRGRVFGSYFLARLPSKKVFGSPRPRERIFYSYTYRPPYENTLAKMEPRVESRGRYMFLYFI